MAFYPAGPEENGPAPTGQARRMKRVELNRGPAGYGDCIPVRSRGEGAGRCGPGASPAQGGWEEPRAGGTGGGGTSGGGRWGRTTPGLPPGRGGHPARVGGG